MLHEIAPIDRVKLPACHVLPTHFDSETLNDFRHRLEEAGVNLTSNALEASLFLTKIASNTRAAFELRCRRIRTEEIPMRQSKPESVRSPSQDSKPPPAKRRRLSGNSSSSVEEVVDVDNHSTASRIKEEERSDDDPFSQPSSKTLSQLSSERLLSLDQNEAYSPFDLDSFANRILVVRWEWFDDSVQARRLLPLRPYIVYQGTLIKTTVSRQTSVTLTFTPTRIATGRHSPRKKDPLFKKGQLQSILDRARADAGSAGPENGQSQHEFKHHGTKITANSRRGASASQAHGASQPPRLLHQTTSEHDEDTGGYLPALPDWVREGKKYACERSTPAPSPNEDFINELKKIKLARLLRGDEIGVRAYSTSIASLAAYPTPFKSTREILALPGCDTKISQLFHEWRDSGGHIKEVEDIESDSSLSIVRLFYEIWGVGAPTAQDFYNRGWQDLDDVVEYGWNTLNRVQQIGLKYYDDFLVKIPRAEVEAICATVLNHARRVRDEGIECCIVGGYRRGKHESGDVDLILSHRDPAMTLNLVHDVVASLEEEEWITHTLKLYLTATKRDQQTLPFVAGTGGHGFDSLDKALVVWQHPQYDASQHEKNPNIHRRVDIIVAPWRTVGCAIVGWSGGTTFQRDLRRYAKYVKGWKFDSSGVRDRGKGAAVDLEGRGGVSRTMEEAERKVFEGMGLVYREPWERCTG